MYDSESDVPQVVVDRVSNLREGDVVLAWDGPGPVDSEWARVVRVDDDGAAWLQWDEEGGPVRAEPRVGQRAAWFKRLRRAGEVFDWERGIIAQNAG